MPYLVSVDETHALVEVVYSGPITTSTRICAMEDGATLLSARQYRRVLVDLRAATAAPDAPGDPDNFALRVAHPPQVRESRLAYLLLPEQPFDLLVGNFAAIRHAAVGQFHRREDALRWLLREPAS
jgi:hypothetical protein